MTLQVFDSFDVRDLSGVICDLHRITVALFDLNLFHIAPENLRQKLQHILLLLIHSLCPVSHNRHIAGEHLLQDHILHIGIILHLINNQMTDVPVGIGSFQTIFQIQKRIYILIVQTALLPWKFRQSLHTVILQKPVVDLIEIGGYIHFLELFF